MFLLLRNRVGCDDGIDMAVISQHFKSLRGSGRSGRQFTAYCLSNGFYTFLLYMRTVFLVRDDGNVRKRTARAWKIVDVNGYFARGGVSF